MNAAGAKGGVFTAADDFQIQMLGVGSVTDVAAGDYFQLA